MVEFALPATGDLRAVAAIETRIGNARASTCCHRRGEEADRGRDDGRETHFGSDMRVCLRRLSVGLMKEMMLMRVSKSVICLLFYIAHFSIFHPQRQLKRCSRIRRIIPLLQISKVLSH
jgi:hypothetical protein